MSHKSRVAEIYEIQDFMFALGDRNSMNPHQFLAYYNEIGWFINNKIDRDWERLAVQWLKRHK